MKGMLLVSSVAVLAVIFTLERSLILARTRRRSGNDSWSLYDRSAKASIQKECGPDPRIPRSRGRENSGEGSRSRTQGVRGNSCSKVNSGFTV